MDILEHYLRIVPLYREGDSIKDLLNKCRGDVDYMRSIIGPIIAMVDVSSSNTDTFTAEILDIWKNPLFTTDAADSWSFEMANYKINQTIKLAIQKGMENYIIPELDGSVFKLGQLCVTQLPCAFPPDIFSFLDSSTVELLVQKINEVMTNFIESYETIFCEAEDEFLDAEVLDFIREFFRGIRSIENRPPFFSVPTSVTD